MKRDLVVYETPSIEIVEFSVEENIATSANLGPGAICTLTSGEEY